MENSVFPFEIYCHIYSFLCSCQEFFNFRCVCQEFFYSLPSLQKQNIVDLIPFEIFYEIYSFLPTCKDRLNFKKTCQLFDQGFPKLICKLNQTDEPLRELWKNRVFGPRTPNYPLFTHKCVKPSIQFAPFLNLRNTNYYCVLGKSKKLFQCVLNLLSQHNHVGGAVINTHSQLSCVASSYAPKLCFLQNDQLNQYQDALIEILKTLRECEDYQHHCRSFLIYFNQDNRPNKNYKLFRSSKPLLVDLLYQEDNPLNLDPVIRSSLDIMFLKKQKKTSMLQMKTFFTRLGFNVNHAVDLFNKTYKTNLILILHCDYKNGWMIRNVEITDWLVPSFLSDYFFWNHMA